MKSSIFKKLSIASFIAMALVFFASKAFAYNVSGKVTDQFDRPVVGVQVSVCTADGGYPNLATTDSNGNYDLGEVLLIPPMNGGVPYIYVFLGYIENYNDPIYFHEKKFNGPVTCNIVMQYTGTDIPTQTAFGVSGIVLSGGNGNDASGKESDAVTGAWVVLEHDGSFYGIRRTGVDGNFDFGLVVNKTSGQHNIRLSVNAENYSPVSKEFTLDSDINAKFYLCAVGAVEICLRVFTLKGYIRDSEGKPVEGATIRIYNKDGQLAGETKSGQGGAYEHELPQGEYEAKVKKKDYANAGGLVELKADTNMDFQLMPGPAERYSISGKVLLPDGAGVENIKVYCGQLDTFTKADGSFMFELLDAGIDYEVYPEHKDYKFTPPILIYQKLSSNIDNLFFTAEPAKTYAISGAVFNKRFGSAHGAKVIFRRDADIVGFAIVGKILPAAYIKDGMVPGKYTVEAKVDGILLSKDVEVIDKDVRCDLAPEFLTLSGKVYLKDVFSVPQLEKGLSSIELAIFTQDNSRVESAVTDAKGVFIFKLPSSVLSSLPLSLWCDRRLPANILLYKISMETGGVTVTPNPRFKEQVDFDKLNFTILPQSIRIKGGVEFADSSASKSLLQGVRVNYTATVGSKSESGYITTDSNGRFEIPAIISYPDDTLYKIAPDPSGGKIKFSPEEESLRLNFENCVNQGEIIFKASTDSQVTGNIVAVQTIDDYPYLVKDKPVYFKLFLFAPKETEKGKKISGIDIELQLLKDGKLLYTPYKVTRTLYSYEGRLFECVLREDRPDYINFAHAQGLDAIIIKSNPDFASFEGDVTVKALITYNNNTYESVKKYTIKEQKEVLNIGWFYFGHEGLGAEGEPLISMYERELTDLFPLKAENIKFFRHQFLDSETVKKALSENLDPLEEIKAHQALHQQIELELLKYNEDLKEKVANTDPVGLKEKMGRAAMDKYVTFVPSFCKQHGLAGFSYNSTVLTCVSNKGDYLFTHEFGHSVGFAHTWDYEQVYSEETNIGYLGYLAAEGFKSSDQRIIANQYPERNVPYSKGSEGDVSMPKKLDINYWDFMTYNAPKWINKEHYGGLFNLFSKPRYPEPPLPQFDLDSKMRKDLFTEPAVNNSAASSGLLNGENKGKYMFFKGFIDPAGMDVKLFPPVILSEQNDYPQGSGVLKIESFDVDGNSLSVKNADLMGVKPEVYSDVGAKEGIYPLNLSIPNSAYKMRIYLAGRLLKEIIRTTAPAIEQGPVVINKTDAIEVTFYVKDDDSPNNLSYSLYFRASPDRVWVPLVFQEACSAAGLNKKDIPLSALPGGASCQLKVEVSDGFNVVESEPSNTFTIPNKAPEVIIASPLKASTFKQGDSIILEAFGFNEEGSEVDDTNATFNWQAVRDSGTVNLGTGKKLDITGQLTQGKYTINLVCTDHATGLTATDFLGIELDNISNPDISILGIEAYPEVPTAETTQIQAKAKLFNVREQAVATVKAYINGAEIASFSPILLPANKVTEIPLAIDTQTYGTSFDLKVEVTDVKDELFTQNNSFTLQYPITPATPIASAIYLYPDQQSFPQSSTLHIAAGVNTLDGREVAEYLWKLDNRPIQHNNKSSFALNLSNLTKGNHSLSLSVKDSQGNESSRIGKQFKVAGSNTLIDPSIEQGKCYYWSTFNNDLNDATGWARDYSYSGDYSIKIVNTQGTNSYWRGQTIIFSPNSYPTKLTLGGYSKADNLNLGTRGLYGLDFYIRFADGTSLWYIPLQLRFTGGTHSWQNREITTTFQKPIKSIQPYCFYYNAKGTVWFDDLYVYRDNDRSKNLLIDPSMEQGKPLYWYTNYQDLNNSTGWIKGDAYTGERSVKITNTKGGNAYWAGQTTNFATPYPTTLTLGGYSKAENLNLGSKGLYALDFYIQFQDGTALWYCPSQLRFSSGTHDWQNREITTTFQKPIKSIQPYCLLYYNAKGTVWFDEIYVYRNDMEAKGGPFPYWEIHRRKRPHL